MVTVCVPSVRPCTRSGRYNAFLFSVATNAQVPLLDLLLNSPRRRHQGAQINCVDEMGRTPVYLAVQHGHRHMAQALIDYGASLQVSGVCVMRQAPWLFPVACWPVACWPVGVLACCLLPVACCLLPHHGLL